MLIVQLSRWSTQIGLDRAMKEIFADGFSAGDGSSDNDSVRTVLHFGETVGTLVKHNVLDWEMLSDLFWIGGMWRAVEPRAKYERKVSGESHLYEHFEALGTRN